MEILFLLNERNGARWVMGNTQNITLGKHNLLILDSRIKN